jgi:uncharacterized FlaG/YvyC family protein
MSYEMISNIQSSPYKRSSGDYTPSPGSANSGSVSGQLSVQKNAEPLPETKSDPKSESESKPTLTKGSDISLKFMVDDDTNQITVLVLDRSTEKVIRTIPAEEMNKLSSGDLLSLFA